MSCVTSDNIGGVLWLDKFWFPLWRVCQWNVLMYTHTSHFHTELACRAASQQCSAFNTAWIFVVPLPRHHRLLHCHRQMH